jgi:tetratricopeptide (TPR) repeat protein
LLRERPDDARARAGLMRALELRAYRRQHLTDELREQALQEAVIVHRLDPENPGPYLIRGAAACRSNEWKRCFDLLGRAYELDPSVSGWAPDSSLAQALMQAGYLERGEGVLRQALAADPFSPGIAFALARALDTQGRHDEALAHFNDDDPFHIYGRWFNAVWRGDLALASTIAERGLDGQRDLEGAYWLLQPSYVAVTRALADPARWPEAMAQIEQWEQSAGSWNFLRVLAPEAQQHAADAIRHLNQARQRGQSSWHLLLWSRPLAWLRRDPAFQDFLRDNGILDYWREHGFPPQCRPAGAGAHCD